MVSAFLPASVRNSIEPTDTPLLKAVRRVENGTCALVCSMSLALARTPMMRKAIESTLTTCPTAEVADPKKSSAMRVETTITFRRSRKSFSSIKRPALSVMRSISAATGNTPSKLPSRRCLPETMTSPDREMVGAASLICVCVAERVFSKSRSSIFTSCHLLKPL